MQSIIVLVYSLHNAWHILSLSCLSGDGAGLLCAIPHGFFREVLALEQSIQLPDPSKYGIAMIFFPREDEQRKECRKIFEATAKSAGFETIAWRKVPTDNSELGPSAVSTEPMIEQWFFTTGAADDQDVEVQV